LRAAAKAEIPHLSAAVRGNSSSRLAKRFAKSHTGQPVAPEAETHPRIRARDSPSSRNL
jgi:hypothetical protein